MGKGQGVKMGKIPKGLSDKAMMQGFEEEATLEDCFLAHEAHEELSLIHI